MSAFLYCNRAEKTVGICLIIDVLYPLMKRPLRIVLCKGSPYSFIDVLGPFQSFCKHEIGIKLDLPTFLLLVILREKTKKYLDLLTFK